MKFLQNENNILTFIKYAPIVIVIVLSVIFTQVFIHQQQKNLDNEIFEIKKVYYSNNKQRVEEEVMRVYTSLKEEKLTFEKALKKQIQNQVYEAHQIASNIFTEESKGDNGHKHSKEHIFQTVKNALGGIRFNDGRGYIFLANEEGQSLLQPLYKEFEGKSFLDYKDANGYVFAYKMIETIQKKTENFDSYYWYKGSDKDSVHKKISFYKYFEPLNILIGTGEYVNDFRDNLQKRILNKIRKIRFGDNGYIFVYEKNGTALAHFKDEFIGKNRINVQDKNGNFVVKDVLQFAQEKKQGFMSYIAKQKPDSEVKSRDKISYIKFFEDWNWVIGSGFYLDKLEDEISKKKVLLEASADEAIDRIIQISLLVTLLCIFISFYISKLISLRFEKYQDNIQREIKNTIEKEKLLIQQSKMATMGEMLGNIAHQWKQPLSIISVSSDLLKINNELETLRSDDVIGSTQRIEDSVHYLSETVDDFRNFFNPNKEKSYFKIDKVCIKTLKLIDSQFKNNSIEVIENIDDIEFYGYENEFLQTLINILKNAKDELVQQENLKRKLIFIDAEENKSSLVVKIKDNASGIPSEIISHVFDSYFTTKKQEGGTGIGLYISKQIIEESMNGKLTVNNVEYQFENVAYTGAEFTIEFPLKK